MFPIRNGTVADCLAMCLGSRHVSRLSRDVSRLSHAVSRTPHTQLHKSHGCLARCLAQLSVSRSCHTGCPPIARGCLALFPRLSRGYRLAHTAPHMYRSCLALYSSGVSHSLRLSDNLAHVSRVFRRVYCVSHYSTLSLLRNC